MIVYTVIIYDTIDQTEDLVEIYSNKEAATDHKESIQSLNKYRFAVVRHIEVKDKFP